jgi:hypothetical protein
VTKSEEKRLVAELLIKKAGDLVEFWSDMSQYSSNPEAAQNIPAEFVMECLTTWLKGLPGSSWDVRLGQVG